MTTADEKFMFELCRRVDESLFNPSPNPKVGCLVVKDGVEIGFGIHEKAGGPHAEVIACESAGEQIVGATVYVSLEPCSHFGKTPPCADYLISKKVKSVVFAISDSSVAGGGSEKLKNAGIEVVTGIASYEAKSALAPWLHSQHSKLPFVRLKYAVTKDGFIAQIDGSSKWISNEHSRHQVHVLRAQSDAVLVGTKTALFDKPQLNARIDGALQQPTAYVMGMTDVSAAMPHAKLLKTHDPKVALQQLALDGVQSVLLEGGKELAQSFLNAELVDEIWVFEGESEFGSGIASPVFDRSIWKVQKQQRFGGDELTVYAPA